MRYLILIFTLITSISAQAISNLPPMLTAELENGKIVFPLHPLLTETYDPHINHVQLCVWGTGGKCEETLWNVSFDGQGWIGEKLVIFGTYPNAKIDINLPEKIKLNTYYSLFIRVEYGEGFWRKKRSQIIIAGFCLKGGGIVKACP